MEGFLFNYRSSFAERNSEPRENFYQNNSDDVNCNKKTFISLLKKTLFFSRYLL